MNGIGLKLKEKREENGVSIEELSNEGIQKDVEEVDETHETEDIERRSSMRR